MAVSSGPTGALRCLATAQAIAGHDVSIVYVSGRDADAPDHKVPGCEVLSFPAVGLRHYAYSPALRRWCREHVRRFDAVHIHSMWLYPNLAASAAARRADVPYWVRPAGSLEPWCFGHKALRKRAYYALIERRTLRHAAAVHVVSEQEVDGVRGAGYRGRIICIPNGVELASFRPDLPRDEARRRLGLQERSPWITYVGRIHAKKGLELLGEVLAEVRVKFPTAQLAITGPDRHDYAAQLRDHYARRGLADAVHFLGERDGEDKAAAYRVGDVFVLPSHSENFGIVVAESMASGTPAVVSRNTPWQVLEQRGMGRWCELAVRPFVDSVIELLSDQDNAQQMAQRALTYAEEHHDWSRIAARVVRGYAGGAEDER